MRSGIQINLPVLVLLLFAMTHPACDKDDSDKDFSIEIDMVFNIDSSGASFSATMLNREYQVIEDYGFVWGTELDPNIYNSNVLSCISNSGKDTYEARVNYGLKQENTYFVKAFAVIGKSVIYSEQVEFICKGGLLPRIDYFSPDSAIWGDTVKIYGEHFSPRPEENKVWFSSLQAEIISCSDTCLEVIVPLNLFLKRNVLTLRTGDLYLRLKKIFIFPSPVIHRIEPDLVTWGDTVEIFGDGFHFSYDRMKVSINGISLELLTENDTFARFIVPQQLKVLSCPIKIHYVNHVYVSEGEIRLLPPKIISINRDSAFAGQSIIFEGKYFMEDQMTVHFDDIAVAAKKLDEFRIEAEVPKGMSRGYVNLSIGAGEIWSQDTIKYFNQVPEITSFSPQYADYRDTIIIKGLDFGDISEIVFVKFRDIRAKIISASDTLMIVTVPERLTFKNTLISVYTKNKQAFADSEFVLNDPVIEKFTPEKGTFGQEITIEGKNFNPANLYGVFKIGNTGMDMKSGSITKFIGTIPEKFMDEDCSGFITYHSGEMYAESQTEFSIKPVKVLSVEPDKIFRQVSKVTITGENFCPNRAKNKVVVCGSEMEVLKASITKLEIMNYTTIEQEICNLTVEVCNYTSKENFVVEVSEPYKKISLFGKGYNWTGAGFSIGGKGYIIESNNSSDSTNRLWEYNPSLNTWTRKNDFMEGKIPYPVVMTIGNNNYLCPGPSSNPGSGNSVWLYQPDIDTWEKMADLPGQPTDTWFTFTSGTRGFLGNKYSLFEYDQENDQWISRKDPPVKINKGYWFSYRSKGYVQMGFGLGLWEYNPDTDDWIEIDGLESDQAEYAIPIVVNDRVFIVGGSSGGILTEYVSEYFPEKEFRKQCVPFPIEISRGISFVIDNKGYIGTGNFSDDMHWLYSMDPAKQPQ